METPSTEVIHRSVLLETSIESLAPMPKDIVIDGTFGGGGHSAALLAKEPRIRLICVDLDEAAEDRFEKRFGSDPRTTFVHANFKDAQFILEKAKVQEVHKVLLDLGTSSFQLLADTRGFSFQSDAPLSMTFASKGAHTGFTAFDIVNHWGESSIADVIFYYGEERRARAIARAIIAARHTHSIETSRALARVIEEAVPRRGKLHPATKTFQAFRIAVNDELTVLKDALNAWWDVLAPGGRIAVITFHSIEDRIVKRWMNDVQGKKRVITKKPFVPTKEELQANPRARSAKLRVIEKPL